MRTASPNFGGTPTKAASFRGALTQPRALALYGAYPRMTWAPDYPDGVPEEGWAETLRHVEETWGRGQEAGLLLYALAPGRVDDLAWRKAHGRWERLSASPGAAVAIQRMVRELDWPIELLIAPTVREPDGLALSSLRNRRHGPRSNRVTSMSGVSPMRSRTEVMKHPFD